MLPVQLSVLELQQARQVQLALAQAAHPAWQRLPAQVVPDAYVQRTLLQTAAPSLLHAASAACSLRLGFLPFTHAQHVVVRGFHLIVWHNYTAHTVLTSFNGIYRRTFFIQQVRSDWHRNNGVNFWVFSFSASSSIRRRIESDSDSLSRTVPVPEQRGQT